MRNLVGEYLGDIDTGYSHWGEYRDVTILGIKLHKANKPKQECITIENAKDCLETALWDYINTQAAFPNIRPNERIWEHVYSYAPTREQLNDYKIEELWRKCGGDFIAFARTIEQAHGIGVKYD